MNEMIAEALNIAYKYVESLNGMKDLEKIENTLKTIAGVTDFEFAIQMAFFTSYDEVQGVLSKLNERESIRKSKGVYYTPADVVRFIVTNTIKSSLGNLTPENINELKLDSNNIDSFCLEKTVFEPTCGAGEFLLEALENKFLLWNNASTDIRKEDVETIVGTIYGNDINNDSIVITKLRLYLCAVKHYGVDCCEGIADILNNNFTTDDYVVSPPDRGIRYDLIMGNPPYVEDQKCGLELVVKYGNIYANVLENAAKRLADGGSMGFIIPLSYSSTPRMKRIRNELLSVIPEQYIMCYADRPDCLFNSVHQKLCILIGRHGGSDNQIYTSNYQYWYQEERKKLFDNTRVVKNTYFSDTCIPKLGNDLDVNVFKKITQSKNNQSVYETSRKGSYSVFVNRRETFWIKAFRETIIHPEYKVFSYLTAEEADYCYCLLNSSLFWWYWISVSDCWHVSKDLNGFKAPRCTNLDKASILAKALRDKLEETKVYVGTKQTDYEYKHKECVNQIHEIDDFVNELFGLTCEEASYIKQFAFRYRVSGGIKGNESN